MMLFTRAPRSVDPPRVSRDSHSFPAASLGFGAAIAGHGVILAWPALCADALRAGTLVAPFTEWVTTGIAYWLVTSATIDLPFGFLRWPMPRSMPMWFL